MLNDGNPCNNTMVIVYVTIETLRPIRFSLSVQIHDGGILIIQGVRAMKCLVVNKQTLFVRSYNVLVLSM